MCTIDGNIFWGIPLAVLFCLRYLFFSCLPNVWISLSRQIEINVSILFLFLTIFHTFDKYLKQSSAPCQVPILMRTVEIIKLTEQHLDQWEAMLPQSWPIRGQYYTVMYSTLHFRKGPGCYYVSFLSRVTILLILHNSGDQVSDNTNYNLINISAITYRSPT